MHTCVSYAKTELVLYAKRAPAKLEFFSLSVSDKMP